MEKDPVLEKYKNEGFGKNAFGWYYNPWIDEYDENYDPHNDEEYNDELKKEKIEWHPKLTQEQIEELIAEYIRPGDNEYNQYLWNHGINPFEEVTNNKKPVKVDVKNNKKEEPTKTKKDEEQKTDKVKLKDIKISLDGLSYGYIDKNVEYRKEVERPLSYDEAQKKEIESILKNNGYDVDNISKAIDPNIIYMLVKKSKELDFSMDDYLELLNGKGKSDVKIKYSLNKVDDSKLSSEEIKNLIKTAKAAHKLNKDSVIVEKDNIFKRAYGKIKNMFKSIKTKKLTTATTAREDNETKAEVKSDEKSLFTKAKEGVVDKANDLKHYTSLRFPRTTRVIREGLAGFKILGVKAQGVFSKENKLETESKIRKIREEGFVQKVDIDHKKAKENTEEDIPINKYATPKRKLNIDDDEFVIF